MDIPCEGTSLFALDSSEWHSLPSTAEPDGQYDSQSQENSQDHCYGDDYAEDADPTFFLVSLFCRDIG